MLNSVGAIGVARCFGWAGKHGCKIFYKPDSIDDYIDANMNGKRNGVIQNKGVHSVQIEFDIKLRELPELMYTPKAKDIARERVAYFQSFMDRLEMEIKGEF